MVRLSFAYIYPATLTPFPSAAMALCDMLTLVFPSPGLIYMYTFGNHFKPLTPISACHAWYVLNEVSIPRRTKLLFHHAVHFACKNQEFLGVASHWELS